MKLNKITSIIMATLMTGMANYGVAQELEPVTSITGKITAKSQASKASAQNKEIKLPKDVNKSATRQSSTRVTLNSGSPEPLDKSKKSTTEKKVQRALTPKLSAAHHDYSFYDASVTLYDDIDRKSVV